MKRKLVNKVNLMTSEQRRAAVWGARLVLAFGLLVLTASLAFGHGRKISKDLEGVDPSAMVGVIVQFDHTPSAEDHQMVRQHGGTLKKELPVVKGASYFVPASALPDLANYSHVVYISPDRQVTGALDYSAAAVNANIGWQYGWDGTGIGVAVIDSGISPDADLTYSNSSNNNPRIVYSQNFADTTTITADLYGHGTHVAGIVAGNGTNSTGSNYTRTFKGIAPNALLINLRALDENGQGTDSAVIAAIQQAISLKQQYNVRVMNLSLGRPVFESYKLDPLCQAVEAAWRAGIVVVVAAGNYGRDNSAGTYGYATITAPGNDPYVITVGAMKTLGTYSRSDDLIASYSSKGPTLIDHVVKPDLVAPGNRTVSVLANFSELPALYPQNMVLLSYYKNVGNTLTSSAYYTLSGTSMATPVVSGAAALLLQAQPQLTPDQVKARFMKTAYKAFPSTSITIDPVTGAVYVSQYDIFTIGAGYLDIAAALWSTDLATGNALSPTVIYNPGQNTVSVVYDPSSVWNSSLVWGSSVVWGTSVFLSGSSVVWGSSVIWGSSGTQGFSVIWGTSVVWGTSQTTSESLNVAINGEN